MNFQLWFENDQFEKMWVAALISVIYILAVVIHFPCAFVKQVFSYIVQQI